MRRTLLPLLLLTAVPLASVAWPAIAREAAAQPAAEAVRTPAGVEIGWTGLSGPVEILLLPAADAPAAKGALLAQAAGPRHVAAVPAWPRPYFLLRDREGREVRVAERLLPLEGGNNFRDLGGYRTADGQTVRWGRYYRSAVMAGLTPDDFQRLGTLGIATVCDFRSTDERKREPVPWPAGVQPTVLATDYGLDMGALSALLRQGPVTAEATRKAMAGFYAEMPFTFAPHYARMMRQLVEGRTPLAFNCSAGKDRTGLAAALLLTVLGVPADTVMADYLISNETYRPAERPAGDDPTARMLANLPADARKALMGVDRSYLEASFAAIEARGGMERYVRDDLGLTATDVETLRRSALEREAGTVAMARR
jgi:protein-tyrosine phosphatase